MTWMGWYRRNEHILIFEYYNVRFNSLGSMGPPFSSHIIKHIRRFRIEAENRPSRTLVILLHNVGREWILCHDSLDEPRQKLPLRQFVNKIVRTNIWTIFYFRRNVFWPKYRADILYWSWLETPKLSSQSWHIKIMYTLSASYVFDSTGYQFLGTFIYWPGLFHKVHNRYLLHYSR